MKPTVTSLKAVSEEIRLRILLLLSGRQACVCELMEVFAMAQSKLSHHLIALRNAGLIQDEKRGKWNFYRLDKTRLTRMNRELIGFISRSLPHDRTREQDKRKLRAVRERMNICC
jgi:ArsR family transcriptional regulator